MSKPTIVFCHGAWHSPESFKKVIAILEPLGYKCVAPALPGSGSVPPVTSINEDIAAVRNAVLKELDAGNNVMMNAHSWGGLVMCNSLDGLSVAERNAEGKKSAVIKLTFTSAFMLDKDVNLMSIFDGKPDPGMVPLEDGTATRSDFYESMYHDVPIEEAEELIAKLRPHSLATFGTPNISAAWRKIPSAYLVCDDDRILIPELQDSMIAAAKEAGAEVETERLFVSHSPYISKPEDVASFLRRAAGELLKK